MTSLQTEQSLGNVYAILTSEFKAPYIRRRLDLYMRKGGMQKLPEGLVQPMVSVGLAGVGRGNDLEKTARFINILQQSIGPEGMAKYLNNSELIKRLSSSMGISPLGLVKSEQQIAAEEQQAMQQAQQQAQQEQGKEETRWLEAHQEYVSPLGKTQVQLEYAWRSSGTLLNTAGRVWTLLNNIEQGRTLRTVWTQLNTHGHC